MATSITSTMRIDVDDLHSIRRASYATPVRLHVGPQPVRASHTLLPALLPDKPTVSSVLGSNKPRVVLGTKIRQRLSLSSAEVSDLNNSSTNVKSQDVSRRSLGDSFSHCEGPHSGTLLLDCSGNLINDARFADYVNVPPENELSQQDSIIITEMPRSTVQSKTQIQIPDTPVLSSTDADRTATKRRRTADEEDVSSPKRRYMLDDSRRSRSAERRDSSWNEEDSVARYRQRISTNPNVRRSLPGDVSKRSASAQPQLLSTRTESMQLPVIASSRVAATISRPASALALPIVSSPSSILPANCNSFSSSVPPSPDFSTPKESRRSDKYGSLAISTIRLKESAKKTFQSFKNALREINKENFTSHDHILSTIRAHKIKQADRRSSHGSPVTQRRGSFCEVIASNPDGIRKVRFQRASADTELGFHVVKSAPSSPLRVTRIEPFCQIPAALLAVGDEILELNKLRCAESTMTEIIALVRSSAELVLKIRPAPKACENRTFAL